MTSRRDLIKRAAILGGTAWVAPAVLAARPASAASCTCYAYKVLANNGTCTAYTKSASAGGSSCSKTNSAWTAALGSTNCSTFGSACPSTPGTYSGTTVTWTGSNQSVTVQIPAGATPLFFGVRYNNGCVYLSGSLASSTTTITKDISNTITSGTPLTWSTTTRTFTATTTGWSSGVNGISHVLFAWKSCGS